MKKKIEVKKAIKLEDVDMKKLETYLKEQKIKKVAHVPSGRFLWAHFIIKDVPTLDNKISAYLTSNKDINIHELAKRALIAFLKVK